MNIHTGALALIATLAFAAPATATPVTVSPLRLLTVTGYIDSGFDQTGEFGTPLTDLSAMRFTTNFTYDPRRGNRTTTSVYDLVQGGPQFPPTYESPVLRATLTIGGVTRAFLPRYYAYMQVTGTFYPGSGGIMVQSDGYETVGTNLFQDDLYLSAYTPLALAPSLDALVPLRASAPEGSGGFQLRTIDGNNVLTAYARGGLVPQTFEIRAVPEPASWALMITGFALTGVALRRRKQRAAA